MLEFPGNPVCKLFGIRYPIIQAGMVWCAGWELASAASNAGGLGLIGAGSMYPEVLRTHIRKCKAATKKPFGVNIPLLYPDIDQLMEIIHEEGVKIVFSSAGNPKTWTSWLKERGIRVVHVVSSLKFALKAEEAGVDAIVAEGFEAGGHNGREETTTMVLIPSIAKDIQIPLIAAGGIGSGASMLSAMTLGADAVQIGSRFVASIESSAHAHFKQAVVDASEGDTQLTLKEITPVRLLKNDFRDSVDEAYQRNASVDELRALLGRGRAKRGMFEGNLEEGELEIGQISGSIHRISSTSDIIEEILTEYSALLRRIRNSDPKFGN